MPFVSDVAALYFCAMDSRTPIHAKVTAFSALAYFITPLDGIVDAIPVVGYGDDAGAIVLAVATIERYMTDEHRLKAKEWLEGNIQESM